MKESASGKEALFFSASWAANHSSLDLIASSSRRSSSAFLAASSALRSSALFFFNSRRSYSSVRFAKTAADDDLVEMALVVLVGMIGGVVEMNSSIAIERR
jgi:hypothetical protein